MNEQKRIAARRVRKTHRVRNKVRGTAERPRLTVFRSSKHIYAQLIDDEKGVTLVSAGSNATDKKEKSVYGGNIKAATAIGTRLAEEAKKAGVSKAAFDRGRYKFHGRIKALAEAARKGGLQF